MISELITDSFFFVQPHSLHLSVVLRFPLLSSCHLVHRFASLLREHGFDDHISVEERSQNYGCFKSSSEKITHHFHHLVSFFFSIAVCRCFSLSRFVGVDEEFVRLVDGFWGGFCVDFFLLLMVVVVLLLLCHRLNLSKFI